MSQPTVVQGPAWVSHNGQVYYSQGNVDISYDYETWNPTVSHGGKLGDRLKSKMAKVSFTPSGMVNAAIAAKHWPYTAASIGASIFTGAALPVVINPVVGSAQNKVTFARGGISKMPSLSMTTLKTVFGPMEITCLGNPAIGSSGGAYFQAIAPAGADASFDETLIISPRYVASFTDNAGVGFTNVEADDAGFEIEPVLELKPTSMANYGVIDIFVDSLGLRAKFKPIAANSTSTQVALTEAQIVTGIGLQDTTSLKPGDVIGQATDLVISGTGLTFTGKYMGLSAAKLVYAIGEFREGDVAFVNKRTWTAGTPQNLWSFA